MLIPSITQELPFWETILAKDASASLIEKVAVPVADERELGMFITVVLPTRTTARLVFGIILGSLLE
jgi:hypothetical protein